MAIADEEAVLNAQLAGLRCGLDAADSISKPVASATRGYPYYHHRNHHHRIETDPRRQTEPIAALLPCFDARNLIWMAVAGDQFYLHLILKPFTTPSRSFKIIVIRKSEPQI